LFEKSRLELDDRHKRGHYIKHLATKGSDGCSGQSPIAARRPETFRQEINAGV